VVAYDDRCSHKRFPLSKGRLMPDGTLECAYHGLRYDMSGKCVMIPSHPTGPISPQAQVRPFPVIEQDGLVWVWPGDPARAETRRPPRLPEIGDDTWETVVVGPIQVPANYLLLIENLLDITHFYPLHDGNIGDIANSRIPVELEEGEVDGNRYAMTIRRTSNYKQPPYLVDWFHYDVVDRHHTHCMMSPAVTRVVMRNAPPGKLDPTPSEHEYPGALREHADERGYVLVHTHTPIDERRHVWRVIVNAPAQHMSKGDPSKSAAKRIAEMFPPVAEEDRWALEQQQAMFDYPDEGYQEVFLKPDIAIRRARKIFQDLVREEQAASMVQAAE
jgi:vanillate O-demethylase monooxygenase subunit